MSNRKISRIIREDYPDNYSGYRFITLIQFNDMQYLTIVDRVTDKALSAYILDLCGPVNIDEETILNIAYNWSTSSRKSFPISYEFARAGISDITSLLYKSFNIDFIERVIGPLPQVELNTTVVKRKKRNIIPNNIQINFK